MYHQICAISPLPGQKPQLASIYFDNTDYATKSRVEFQKSLNEDILTGFEIMLKQNNNLVNLSVSLRDLMLEGKASKEMELVLHAHKCNRPGHERKYNILELSKVAALTIGMQHGPLDVVLKRKASHKENGDELLDEIILGNRLRYPLCYPLILFDGCGGWHSKLSL